MKIFRYKYILAVVLILTLLTVAYKQIWPRIGEHTATAQLRQAYNQQLLPLTDLVNKLVDHKPQHRFQCEELSHTYTKTNLYCQDFLTYTPNLVGRPDSSRPQVLAAAQNLDETLLKNGWTADRPQDSAKTIADAIPTTPLKPFYVTGVPLHKNIGDISCNLRINFEGPTNDTFSDVILVNQFSCQQHTSFFMLHASNHVNSGFGG